MDGLQAGDPDQIGPYRLLGRLGEGGMGRVFLGASRGGRKVAIKVVHSHFASDPEFRRRFAREVTAARQVGGFHTALVVDADPDADSPWMATAFIPGPSLADAIARQGPFPPAAVRDLAAALAEGLAAIHACGIIHRDLKPGNIILADDGPRIIDFGIAQGADTTRLTGSNAVIGTLRHMSPEQLNGQELTPQSDVFALGSILAYAATGRDPFDAPTIPAVINRILNDPPDLSLLTGPLHDIIGACLAKNPAFRPAPADLLALLDPAQGTAQGPGPAAAAAPGPHTAWDGFPRHHGTHAARPERPAGQEPSSVSTITFKPDPAPQQPWQAPPGPWPPADYPRTAPGHRARPTRGIRRPAYRRPVVLGAAVIVAAAGVTALSLAVGGQHPASTRQHPASTRQHPASYLWASAVLTNPTSRPVNAVAFGPGSTLATADLNGSTYIWNTATKKITGTLTDPKSKGVASVAFGPGGTVATADLNGAVYVWDASTQGVTATYTHGSPASKGVDSVAFGSGATLASADRNGFGYLWTPGNVLVIANPTHGGTADSVAFGPGGTILAVGQVNGAVEFYNTATQKFTATGLQDPVIASRPDAGIVAMAFGPGGTTLATADQTGNAYVWNLGTARIITSLPAAPNAGATATVAFGPGGTTLATSDGTNTTYLWPIASHDSRMSGSGAS